MVQNHMLQAADPDGHGAAGRRRIRTSVARREGQGAEIPAPLQPAPRPSSSSVARPVQGRRRRGQDRPALRGGAAVAASGHRGTFVSLCAEIDNWRWAGPCRSSCALASRLPERRTQIVNPVQRRCPHSIFGAAASQDISAKPPGHRSSAQGRYFPSADEFAGPVLPEARLQAMPLSLSLDDGGPGGGSPTSACLLDVLAGKPGPVRSPRRGRAGLVFGIDGVADSWSDSSPNRPKPLRRRQLGPPPAAFALLERTGRGLAG